jgi:hypothetical protein
MIVWGHDLTNNQAFRIGHFARPENVVLAGYREFKASLATYGDPVSKKKKCCLESQSMNE